MGIPGLLTIRPPFHRQEPPPLGDVAADNDYEAEEEEPLLPKFPTRLHNPIWCFAAF